ncbi:MAG: CHAD domain-containing protein, partial [Chloroflexota bacterium]
MDDSERRSEVLGNAVWSILGGGAAQLEASTASPEWWVDDARLKAVRIALRRLHAAVQAIGPYVQPRQARALARELQLPMQALGAVRDWDVLAAELASAVAEDARLHRALEQAREERVIALAAAQRRVAGGRLRQLHSHLFRYAATCLRAPAEVLGPVLRAVLSGRCQLLAERLAALELISEPPSARELGAAGQPESADDQPDVAGQPVATGSEANPTGPELTG